MGFRLYPITPDKLMRSNEKQLIKAIKKVLQAESEQHRRMFAQATRTWSAHNQPKFRRKTVEEPNQIYSVLGTSDFPFAYVELGTKVRYMHMTPGFTPKSVPRSLRARPGSGGPAGINYPKPGIEARDFRKVIAAKRDKILVAKLQAVINTHLNQISGRP